MGLPSALLYDLILNQNIHCRNTLFNHLFWFKKGYYGNECFGLGSLSRFYTTILSQLLLYDPEHSYAILNTPIRSQTLSS